MQRTWKHMRVVLIALALAMVTAAPAFAAAEGAGPLASLGINLGFLIAQIINFALIFALLYFLLWRPLTNMLDARTAKIQQGLEDAAAAANNRRNAEAEAEQIRAQARGEAQRIVEEGRTRAEELARGMRTEAQTEAERIRTDARTASEQERNQQLADLRTQVANIAVALSQRLIGESLDQQRQQALVNDFFARVPTGAQRMDGQVEVVSAMPLSPEEQSRIRSEVGAQDVRFIVDPDILGGLIIRGEDNVVDGSVRSSLNGLAARLR